MRPQSLKGLEAALFGDPKDAKSVAALHVPFSTMELDVAANLTPVKSPSPPPTPLGMSPYVSDDELDGDAAASAGVGVGGTPEPTEEDAE